MQSISCSNPMPVSSRFVRRVPSIRPTVGKFWMPAKPMFFNSRRNVSRIMNGSVAHTRRARGVGHCGKDLVRHLLDDLVRVAVGHQAGERTSSGHAEPARIINDDQVDATGFLALGADPRAGAATDNRQTRRDLFV